jgi:hypothetical protein
MGKEVGWDCHSWIRRDVLTAETRDEVNVIEKGRVI